MSSRILEIAKKSSEYLANFEANVIRIIEGNKDLILDANRKQFISSKDATGKSLTRASTGSTKLSKAYAKRTGKTKPNFLLTGQFQDEMIFFMPNLNEYFVNSRVRPYLSPQYGGSIFGIAPNNQPRVKAKNNSDIVNDYMKIFR